MTFSDEDDGVSDAPKAPLSIPLAPPTTENFDTIRQVILAGFGDRVAKFVALLSLNICIDIWREKNQVETDS
jgi:hypothetical protein